MKQFALFSLLLLGSTLAHAQAPNPYWQPLAGTAQESGYRYLSLSEDALQADLPATIGPARSTGQTVTLPLPNGQQVSALLYASTVMPSALSEKYPQIQAFQGHTPDGRYRVHAEYTPHGFFAQLHGEGHIFYVDPAPWQGTDAYIAYDRKDYHRAFPLAKNFIEPPVPSAPKTEPLFREADPLHRNEESFAGLARNYRLAVAASGEYTSFHGGTVADGLAAIVTSINRVNGIFEAETGISFTLIDNNDQIVYTDASTDPYSNSSPTSLLGENQTNLDEVIGSANYDIGHVFTTASGGVAFLGSVCSSLNKAKGTTGTSNPTGDGFDVDFVAHEIGHQFSATHSFNGGQGNCAGGQYSSNSAYEPGSGSTIMSYANICGDDNIQSFSDPYFHVKSLDQMQVFTLLGNGLACATTTNDGNRAPVLEMPTGGWTIPANTPFRLEGSATDADGDSITYCWEQYDLGPQGSPDDPSLNAPLFRSFLPTASGERWFPRAFDVVNGTQTFGEILPSYERSMTFMLTARDGQGGLAYESVDIEVTTNSAPFVVTAPAASSSHRAGSSMLVTWDVAGTRSAPISTRYVSVELSTDGGFTYPHTLTAATPNDGEEYLWLPEGVTSNDNARIRVSAVNNVYFNLNGGDFSITDDGSSNFSALLESIPTTVCSPDTARFTLHTRALNGFTGTLDISLSGLAQGLNASWSTTSLSPGDSAVLTITDTDQVTPGSKNFVVTVASNGVSSQQLEGSLLIAQGDNVDIALLYPENLETSVSTRPTFFWSAQAPGTFYDVQLASDSLFTDILDELANLQDTLWKPGVQLTAGNTYYWRVRASNDCATGDYQTAAFSTIALDCNTSTANDLPITISEDANVTYNSSITVTNPAGPVHAVEVIDLNITHTYVSDLNLKLVHADGTAATLVDNICNQEDNFLISFSDLGESNASIPCPPTDGGTYEAAVPLSAFSGKTADEEWTLVVTDEVGQDGGTINGWSLNVCVALTELELTTTLSEATTVDLAWTAGSLTDIDQYELKVAENDGPYTQLAMLGSDQTTYTHANLAPATTYRYRVRAHLLDGTRTEYSNVGSATTTPTAPTAPSGLLVTSILDYQAELSWVDNSDNEAGFIIERAEGTPSGFVQVGTTGQNITSYIDPNRAHGITYYYRVAAQNQGGQSAYSATGSVTVTQLDEAPATALHVYPNPGHEAVTLRLEGGQGSGQVRLLSPQGQVLWSGTWNQTQQELTLPTPTLPAGMYLLQVQTSEGNYVERWVKQ